MIKSIKGKILLFFSIATFLYLTISSVLDIYRIKNTMNHVMVEELKDYAKTMSANLADFLYYGNYSKTEEILKENPALQIKNIIVVNKDGYIIASKSKGLVLFEKFPRFKEEVEGTKELKIIKNDNGFIFIEPVTFGKKVLGYLLLKADASYYNHLIQQVIVHSILIFIVSFVIIVIFIYYMGSLLKRRIDTIITMLQEIEKGNFKLSPPQKSEDEFDVIYEGILQTARKLRENLVSRKFYKSVINSLTEPLVVIDEEGKIVDANRSFCKLLRQSYKRLIHRPISKVVPELASALDTMEKNIDVITIDRGKSEKYLLPYIGKYKNLSIITLNDVTNLIKYQNKLKKLSEKDPLTGAFNRRVMNELLSVEMERAKRYKRPLSLIFFDIDHFKKINDTYGHDVGDEVLKKVVEVVRKNMRKADILTRWGGEEFLILLPETDLEAAKVVAEKMRKAIENTDFGKVKKVTVSFGVTQLSEDDTIEKFIKKADEAMYKAKNNGRNRVEVY